MTQITPYFFGYGSLVNRATHPYPGSATARLTGWRRVWQQTDLRQVAFLSVVPDPDCTLDGLIAEVPGNDWTALDEREWAYGRIAATDAVAHSLTQPVDIAVYAVPASNLSRRGAQHPILLSYLDVVVQGYLREFGAAGVQAFFDTTTGWAVPILNDRADPVYQRHQPLTAAETALVDDHLARRLGESHP